MFIGHIALALAAKRATPRVSLATLLVAAQWADLLWPVFLALGVEHVRIQPGKDSEQFRAHTHTKEEYDFIGHWLQESWALPDPAARPSPVSFGERLW